MILTGECSVYQRGNNDLIEEPSEKEKRANKEQVEVIQTISDIKCEPLQGDKDTSLVNMVSKQTLNNIIDEISPMPVNHHQNRDRSKMKRMTSAGFSLSPQKPPKRQGITLGSFSETQGGDLHNPFVKRFIDVIHKKNNYFRARVEERNGKYHLKDSGTYMIQVNTLKASQSFGEFALITGLMDERRSATIFCHCDTNLLVLGRADYVVDLLLLAGDPSRLEDKDYEVHPRLLRQYPDPPRYI